MEKTLANIPYILRKEFHVNKQNVEFGQFIDIYVCFIIFGPKQFH